MRRILSLSIAALAMATAAGAQVAITLPDETQSSTLTANVMEQATVTVPATITFNVTDVTVDTLAAASPITVTNIVLRDGGHLRILVKAANGGFEGGSRGVNYSASDVTWGDASWNNGSATPNTLTTWYQSLADCSAWVTACNTTDAKFKLTARPITYAGTQTLVMNYKFEAIGG